MRKPTHAITRLWVQAVKRGFDCTISRGIPCKVLDNCVAQAPSPVFDWNYSAMEAVRPVGRDPVTDVFMRVQPIASISDAGAGLGTAFENKKPVHRQGLLCHSVTRGCHHFLRAMGCNLLVYGRLAECVEVRH